MRAGHYANFSGCLGLIAPPEFIIVIARRKRERWECEPETNGRFFFQAIYIQGNPENVPNLNTDMGMVQFSLFLHVYVRVCTLRLALLCLGIM